jgi:alkylation response protein AidB-like acyl-CoA dehydrogenase
MAKNRAQELTKGALALLGRFASSEATDNPQIRKASEKVIFEATRSGFKLAAAAARQFKAVQQLTQSERPASAKQPDLFDLTPSDEQSMIRDEMRKFGADKLRPAALHADEHCEAPPEIVAESVGLGTTLMNIPESLGGAATDRAVVTQVLVAEALAHGDMGLAVACLAPAGVAAALTEWGSKEQQSTYLGALAGENPPAASIAVMEPRALFSPFELTTTAKAEGLGFVLNGVKALVPRAAQGEFFLIAAHTEGSPAVFIVESSAPGLRIEADPGMGVRAAGLGRLVLENVKVPASARMTDLVYGDFINRSRLAWCALASGTAKAVLDYVIPYVNDRKAFGEPISNRQAVAFAVANIGIESDGMRLLTWRAASLAERGKPFAAETAWARRACAEHGMRIGSDGVQLLGGHGYTKEHPVERWYRDLRAIGLMEGGVLV